MSVFKPNSRHLQEVLIFCFHLKKPAAEAHRMLSSTYGKVLSERACRDWFQSGGSNSHKTPCNIKF